MSERTATLLVALSAGAWGTWSLFSRSSGVAPIWQSSFILLVIGLCTLPLALASTRQAPPRARTLWLLVLLLGLFDAGNYVFFFSAIERGPVGVAVLAHYLAPVIVAALAPALLGEALGRRTPGALLASLVGLGLLLFGSGRSQAGALPAALLGGASAFFYAGNTLVSKRLLGPFTGAELLSYHCLLASLLLAGAAPFVAGPAPALGLLLGKTLAGALLLGCGAGAVFYLGLARIPAQRAAVLTYFEPLVAALVGVLAWGERLDALSVLGAVLIVAGGVLVATADDGAVGATPGASG